MLRNNSKNLLKQDKIVIIRSAIGSLASVGFIKLLKKWNFKIVGTDIVEENVGNFFVDNFYKVPRAENENEVIKSYLSIAKKEKANWILSGPEEEIVILSKYKDVFKSTGVYMLHSDYNLLDIITDKYNAYKFFKKNDISLPRTKLALDIKDIVLENPQNRFILKPRKGRGSTNIVVFSNSNNTIIRDLKNPQNYIIQEYILGLEYTVDVLCDLYGCILNIVPRRRIKVDSGISVIGKTEKNETLISITEKILSSIKIIGGACFQFIKSNETGEYYLTDVNPRFGGGVILSLASSRTFRDNLRNLLEFKWDKLLYKSYDFNESKMFRYYDEIYK